MGAVVASTRPTETWARPAGRRHRGLWLVVVVFATTRILDAVVLAVRSRQQFALSSGMWPPVVGDNPTYFIYRDSPAAPGYWSVITNWDGQWYWKIATEGLHSGPGASAVDLWAWAFGPGFPLATGALMQVTGLSFPVAATVLNLTCSLVGVILLWDLVRRSAGELWATCASLLYLCFPSGMLFQVAYSEAMGFALLMAFLWLFRRGWYWWAVVPVIALAYTRLITPPMAIIALVQLVVMWRARAVSPLRARPVAGLVTIGAVAAAGAFLWSWTAALIGGQSTGAVQRAHMAGTRVSWIPDAFDELGIVGPVLVVIMIVTLVAVACAPMSRPLGLELRVWLAAYPAFVLLATQMTSGVFRYLLLCPPLASLALLLVPPTDRRRMVGLTAASCVVLLASQWWYTAHALVLARSGAMMP